MAIKSVGFHPITHQGAKEMYPYSPTIEAQIRDFYWSLYEKDRRRYGAIEAKKLGHGGIGYIARVVGCDRHTLQQGMNELTTPLALAQSRIRREGGGRKDSIDVIPDLEATFLQVLADHTAGSPTNSEIKWTNLTQQEIVDHLASHDIKVSVTVVKRLLRKHGFRRRKAQKKRRTGETKDRDEQFLKIARLKSEYIDSPNPIISIDTKKKS